MKKKFVAVLLSALTAGSLLLSGCGGGSSSGDSGSGSSGGDDTLTVMCVGTEADTYIDAYNAIAEKFSEDNEYGVTVEIEFYENEQYKTKLTTLMASNAVPDIFFTWELSYLEPFVEGGKVADITSYLEEDQEWKNSFADGTLDLLSYDGKNYGVPTQKSLCVMFYNKQIFEENGVEVPTTYEEFLEEKKNIIESGVSRDNEEYEYGLYCMSVPLHNHLGPMDATLGVTGPKARIFMKGVDDIEARLKDIAAVISEKLIKIKYIPEY